MIDYAGSIRAHAPRLRRTVQRWLWRTAPETVATELEVAPEEPVLYAERTDEIDDTVVAWDQVYIARSFGDPLTEEDLAKVNFIETWTRRAEFEVVHCQQTVEAVAAGPDDERRLLVKPGVPLLKSTEIYSTLRQRPAGLFVSFYHPQYVCIRSQYEWQERAKPPAKSGQARARNSTP
jgi:DNA-binding GntR family transcriptional regulator